MSDFVCPEAAAPLIASLGLGPLPNVMAALVNPWQLSSLDVDFIKLNLLLAVPTLQVAIDLEYALILPDIPFVTFTLPDPELALPDISLQLAANLAMSVELKLLPLNILLGILDFSISLPPVFPDVVIDLLPDVPGIEVLALCATDILEPMFTPEPEPEDYERPTEQTIFAPTDI